MNIKDNLLDQGVPQTRPSTRYVGWKSPSNIALIKYWGKRGDQLPCNPSLSFTLSSAYTETSVYYSPRKDSHRDAISMTFQFEGNPAPSFQQKIHRLFTRLEKDLPFLKEFHFDIRSRNSFPHSSGIASSASAFSALALCLSSIAEQMNCMKSDFFREASILARLGSGSACRSLFGKAALWGETSAMPGSSDQHAIPVGELLHPVFTDYRDAILLIDDAEKKVSSTRGHKLMENHPFAEVRYQSARQNLSSMLEALKSGDQHRAGILCEAEAMQLHALMMCSNPSYLLLHPHSLLAIDCIKRFREESKLPVYFTIDAGPNLHVLYAGCDRSKIKSFIEEQLVPLCKNGKWIDDRVGDGPVTI